jgi:flagellar biosynthesis/type III secretory pathway M-ring protein FliF/YscJ
MRRNFRWKTGLVLTALIFMQAHGQSAHYLTQKIELENTLGQRISTAIERILGNSNFIVDVKADVEFQPERKIEEVYKPSQKSVQVRRAESSAKDQSVPGVETPESQARKAPQTDIYRDILPGIPGGVFEAELPLIDDQKDTEAEIIPPAADDEPIPSMAPSATEIEDEEEELYSRSVSQLQERVPILRKLDISVILQEGVHPNLVESVRQVAMVAAHFDRKRGDVLSIMTTAFKLDESRKELEAASQPTAQYKPSIEESARDEETRKLIGDIQRQIENLNDNMRNASVSSQPSPSENVLLGVIDKLTARNSLQDDIETQRLLAEQQARLRMLAQDTSRLKKLQDEIAALKLQLAIQQDDRIARAGASDESAQKLREKEELEAAIAEKIDLLASTQAQLNTRSTAKAPMWVWLLAALMLISLFSGSLFWMQRSKKAAVEAASAASETELRKKLLSDLRQDNVVRSTKAKAPDPEEEDEELSEIRSSIVNLSVANPDAASALMRKWLKESGDEGAAETDSKGENKNG